MARGKTQFSEHHRVTPRLVPDSAVTETTTTCWMKELLVSNQSGAAAKITVADRQGTPIPLLKNIDIDPGTVYHDKFEPGIEMVDGFTFVSNVNNALAISCSYAR